MRLSIHTLLLLCALFVLILPLSACRRSYATQKQPVKAVKGILDLTDWDFERDGPVKLSGQWNILWRDFKLAGNCRSAKDFVSVPGAWNSYIEDGVPVGALGFASYYLTILLPEKSRNQLAIFIPDQWTAYELYADRDLIAQAGKIGNNAEKVVPRIQPKIGILKHSPKRINITLYIANFHFFKGGVKRVPSLGLAAQIYGSRELRIALELFLSGSFFMIGLYHIGLFISRRKDLSVFLFGIINLLVCIITLSTGERFLHSLVPAGALSAIHFYVIIYLATYLVTPMLFHFIAVLFGGRRPMKLARYNYAVAGIFMGSVVVLPAHIFTGLLPAYLAFILILSVYMIAMLLKAAIRRQPGAAMVLGGLLILISAAVFDILKAIGFYSSGLPRFASFALFIFIWIQSAMLSRNFAQAFRNIENLSDELEKKNEDLTRLDTLKDEFLSNTSHELRTPLNGIIGLADSMLKGIGGPHSHQTVSNLKMISASGNRLANLVNDILDFSNLKQQHLHLKITRVDLKAMVDVVFELTRPLVGYKDIRFINECEDLPAVLADENRLEQILYNLIGNAVKFTHQGVVMVTARQEKQMATIFVCDTGIGVPLDKQSLIFNSFQQAEGTIARHYGGTGLGLTITRQLIELHGGEIRVESPHSRISPMARAGGREGSCFRLTIPLAEAPTSGEVGPDSPETIRYFVQHENHTRIESPKDIDSVNMSAPNTQKPPEGAARILAVDDDVVNLKVIENQLSLQQFEVVKAQNGQDALQMIHAGEPFDLILLDLMMPGINGFEVCREIRKKYNPNELPIIILTAKNALADFKESLSSGANDYLTKPFSFAELIHRAENQLKLSQYYQDLKELNEDLQNEVAVRTRELEHARNNAVGLMEKAKIANHSKSRFLANMSHELRTPLNVILGFSELMSRDPDISSEQLNNLEAIGRSGEHLLALINDVLELSKIEAGRIILHKEDFDLNQLLYDLREMFRVRVREKGLYFDIKQRTDVPQFVSTDQSKLRQILINLLGNALKFTGTGGIVLSVSRQVQSAPAHKDRCTLRFEVTDTGRGVKPQDQDLIFDAFFQTDSEHMSRQGTGLGLPISQKYAGLLGGTLTVESQADRGSKFSFDIPVALADGSEIVATSFNRRIIGLAEGQPALRLLVVDDNKNNRRLLVKLLRTVGFDVAEAVNGRTAIEKWKTWKPHLIWMDMRMPVMDGYAATAHIKKSREGDRAVIVALTASAFEEDRIKVLEHGGDDYVRKPFRESEIFEKLSRHLGVKFSYSETRATPESRKSVSLSNGDIEREAATLVPGLLEELGEATEFSDAARIDQVIEEIRTQNAQLAESLGKLAEKFAYDEILTLVAKAQTAARSSE